MKVAFQGIGGAYSEAALYAHFGTGAVSVPCKTSEEVVEAVVSGAVDYGFLPAENSIAGSVAINHDLLLRENVRIVAESYLRIEHCLLAPSGSALPSIKAAYSHPHALEQCRAFLGERGIEARPEYDTAGAAQMIAKNKVRASAAIASELCASLYGLDILARNIQSNPRNFTRFLAFVKGGTTIHELGHKTSIAFRVQHKPGALVGCLQRLAKLGINLARLESRPIPGVPWEYQFFADFECDDPKKARLALEEMKIASMQLKVLGTYAKAEPPTMETTR